MNHLELNELEELTFDEMTDTEGGNWAKWIFEMGSIYDAVTDGWEGLKEGFKAGNA
ncbi:hypothetical protein [Sphingobacterium prati]|uniref:hypothetical protein n=1 Tax=Sphingobacterium prati TaxID=2737006 RepID=UPI0015581B4F|nr:hypothetical protein [Sphingobacterium prati]NPE44894.1 hypothetical protein [Sphingobacterium prati]